MRKQVILLLVFSLISLPNQKTYAAIPTAGATCTKVGLIQIYKSKKYTCVRLKGKVVWNKGVKLIPLTPSPTPFSSPASTDIIAARIYKFFDSTNGFQGVYLKKLNGGVIADYQSTLAFDPASSLKALVALYVFDQAVNGKLNLLDEFPSISSGNPRGCSPSKTNTRESFETAIKLMMQVSDNDRTTALISHFGAFRLNSFARSIGLANTSFKITTDALGFNPFGCVDPFVNKVNPLSVSGNFSTLQNLTRIWELASALPQPFRQQFMNLTAGREMSDNQGYDFTGIWPALQRIVLEEAPATLERVKLDKYIQLMRSNTKGGSNALCFKTENCTTVRWWVSMISLTSIPICDANGVINLDTYVWGYFSANADSASTIYDVNNPAIRGFIKIGAEPMREQIHKSLENFGQCKL